ncbi:homoserine kinase [Govanella unica]|uniref:Homoserine kinase n=1 Tax=Govanella unica TaxID=2975056 RepID=A0A9X3TX52_9PROT|nr:homoserine kinase [Govania unica]MDA5193363.1 homoserine kinase [Govania unica]
MAVYTEVSADDISAFVAEYGLGAVLTFKGIAEGVENSNYLLQTEGGSFILTLYEKRVKPEDLPYFITLMDHLAARGITCPRPVHDLEGVALKTLCDRPAAMVSFLNGISLKRPSFAHCGELGRALAELHQAAADFTGFRANALSLEGWQDLAAKAAPGADSVAPGLEQTIRDEIAWLEAAWPHDLPSGVIHADLFPDNVFFLGEKLSGIIDFYFACNDALAYDLAICINAWCFEPDGAFNATKARQMVAGYQAVRPMTAQEIAAFPILCRGAALRFLLTRLYDWRNQIDGALVRPHNPIPFLERLRFHQQSLSAATYGFDAE